MIRIINDVQCNFQVSLNQLYNMVSLHKKNQSNNTVKLKVVVVLAEGIVESLCHSQPAEKEKKLHRHEYWIVEVQLVSLPDTIPDHSSFIVYP